MPPPWPAARLADPDRDYAAAVQFAVAYAGFSAPPSIMRSMLGLGGLAVALGNPQFRLFTLSSLPSLLGTWIQRVAVGWLAWELTGSGAWLGAIAFADMFPVIVCTPVAGAFADRLDRLRASRILQYALAVQAAVLAALVIGGLITIELLVGLTFLQGFLQAAHHPFRQSLVANLVAPEELNAAIAVNSMTWHASRSVGPALAGLAILGFGAGSAIAVNAVSYVPFLIALHRLRPLHRPPPAGRRSAARIPREIVAATRFVIEHRAIGPMFLVLMAISIAGRAAAELLPGFAGAVFGRDAMGLAWLTSAAGFGAMLGALWASRSIDLARLPARIVTATITLALSLFGFVATQNFTPALICLAISAFALTIGGIGTQTIVQASVPEAMRGRVMGLYGTLWLGLPALGALVAGALSDWIGLRAAVGGLAVLPALAWLWALGRRKAVAREIGAAAAS